MGLTKSTWHECGLTLIAAVIVAPRAPSRTGRNPWVTPLAPHHEGPEMQGGVAG